MTTTYIVAIDGSEGSLRAANFATERAKASSAKLVLAYVIEWSPYSFNTPQENAERHKRREEEIERAQTSVLDPVASSFKDKGVAVETARPARACRRNPRRTRDGARRGPDFYRSKGRFENARRCCSAVSPERSFKRRRFP